MSIGILGKKIGMTRIFKEEGRLLPVTVVEAGPCPILQIKTTETDGYNAIQLAFEDRKTRGVNKPDSGRFKKAGLKPLRFVREIRLRNFPSEYQIGQKISVENFNPGEFVDVTGTSIGKGFQGGIKRWHWKGGPTSHGSMSHRRPGSIGASSTPSRVWKGHHLPGHMGGQKVTVKNLEIIKVDKEKNLLAVKGAVPGHKNSYLVIKKVRKRPEGNV